MLDIHRSEDVVLPRILEHIWEMLGSRARLPVDEAAFFQWEGPVAAQYADRRQHPRFHYPRRAILIYSGRQFAAYTKDVSRSGLSFYHAEQLLPCETIQLVLMNGASLAALVRRCRRVDELCYDCGARIESCSRPAASDLLAELGAAQRSAARP